MKKIKKRSENGYIFWNIRSRIIEKSQEHLHYVANNFVYV